jgi:hypothetical protein
MGPDNLLCSSNARPRKALVGRAHWTIIQPPFLKNQRMNSEDACICRDWLKDEGKAGYPYFMAFRAVQVAIPPPSRC